MKASFTNVAAVLVALFVGASFGPKPDPILITQVDTLDYSAFRDSLEAERLDNSGLRAKVRGYESRQPTTIVRTDTLVTPPDTVLQLVRVEGQSLLVAPLIKATSYGLSDDSLGTSQSLYSPELHRYDVSQCDDGWSWASGELVCDRARFGHLALVAEVGIAASPFLPTLDPAPITTAGVEWTPSYRSAWRLSAGTDPRGRLAFGVTRRWNVW